MAKKKSGVASSSKQKAAPPEKQGEESRSRMPTFTGHRRASVFNWMILILGFLGASLAIPSWDTLYEIPRTGFFVRGYVIGYVLLFLVFVLVATTTWRRIDRP